MPNTSNKAVALVNAIPDFADKACSKIKKAANVDASHKPVLKVNLGAISTVHVYDNHSPIIIIINLTIKNSQKDLIWFETFILTLSQHKSK